MDGEVWHGPEEEDLAPALDHVSVRDDGRCWGDGHWSRGVLATVVAYGPVGTSILGLQLSGRCPRCLGDATHVREPNGDARALTPEDRDGELSILRLACD